MIKFKVGVEQRENGNARSRRIPKEQDGGKTPITPFVPQPSNDNRQWPTGYMFNPVYLFNRKVW